MDIDILCRVVDNFGDIGVAYRLARSLSERGEAPRLRLVVDNLEAFAALCPAIDSAAPGQLLRDWEIYAWAGSGAALEAFTQRPPRILVECFACGRPDWLEELIFDPKAEPCFIVDLEHLSAEAWAEDFHRLPSLTGSSKVRKALFFPGFSPRTGGLLVDRDFELSRAAAGELRSATRRELLARLPAIAGRVGMTSSHEEAFWVSVFSYERDYRRIVADLAAFGSQRPLLVLAAAGKSGDSFWEAWEEGGRPFPLLPLPFLPQEVWDRLLLLCDFSIVRGEDSWSRASLGAAPFLWQAYPQEGKHQLVKVRAFLDALRPHFAGEEALFALLEELYLAFNDREVDRGDTSGEESLLPLLEAHPRLLRGFGAFSSSLALNADLASNLVTFLLEIV